MTQRGLGFFGSEKSGFLVYFPTFVLSVGTSVCVTLQERKDIVKVLKEGIKKCRSEK
jgi:hypothetical protein